MFPLPAVFNTINYFWSPNDSCVADKLVKDGEEMALGAAIAMAWDRMDILDREFMIFCWLTCQGVYTDQISFAHPPLTMQVVLDQVGRDLARNSVL